MLREFIKCTSTLERVELLKNTVINDWTDEELNTIIEIMGIEEETSYLGKEDKIVEIAKGLSASKVMEKNEDFDFGKIDIISTKNNDVQSRMEEFYSQF